MKKISKISCVVFVSAIMVFCMTACGGQKNDMSSNGIMPPDGGTSETVVTTKEEPQATVDEDKRTDESAYRLFRFVLPAAAGLVPVQRTCTTIRTVV